MKETSELHIYPHHHAMFLKQGSGHRHAVMLHEVDTYISSIKTRTLSQARHPRPVSMSASGRCLSPKHHMLLPPWQHASAYYPPERESGRPKAHMQARKRSRVQSKQLSPPILSARPSLSHSLVILTIIPRQLPRAPSSQPHASPRSPMFSV